MKLFVLSFGLLSATSVAYGQHYQTRYGYGGAVVGSVSAAPIAVDAPIAVSAPAPAVVAAAPARAPKVHEIHTTSEREVIRVEEYKRPRQVIRIHEAPAPPPEIIRVQAPPEPQKVIRVVQRARPTRVTFTNTGPEIQEVNIPIRQVQQVVRPVVVEQQQVVRPVVQQVVQAAPVVHQQVVRPVVHQQVVQAAPVYHRQVVSYQPQVIQAAAPIQQTYTSRIQTFSAQPVGQISYGAAPVVQSFGGYTSAPAQVSYNAGYYRKSSAAKKSA